MKLHPRKRKDGHVTSYYLIIGSKEAREAGLIDENGDPIELQKRVDTEKQVLIVTKGTSLPESSCADAAEDT